jgi:hypothetical protein
MKIKVRGLYKPAGTSYRVYEAMFTNGDTHTAGAFSEDEFRRDVSRFGEEVVSVRCLNEKDAGNGWKEVRP